MAALTPRSAQNVLSWAVAHHLERAKAAVVAPANGNAAAWPVVGSWHTGQAHLLVSKDDVAHALRLFGESSGTDGDATRDNVSLDAALDGANDYEKHLLGDVVPSHSLNVSFDDIGALKAVKRVIHEVVINPLRRPGLFSKSKLTAPAKGVLLFGPPGTGKTMVAKAIATSVRATFISVTAGSITSKWYGDGEKYAQALFTLAGRLAPSIIFIDEIDALLSQRGGQHEHGSTRRIKNQLMMGWDGLRSHEQVMVVGASNRPQDLDDAVLRRLPRRLLVDLPDRDCRVDILRVLLKGERLHDNVSFDKIAHATAGFTGSDLKNLCVTAALRPIRAHLDNTPAPDSVDSDERDPFRARERRLLQERADADVELAPITQRDFDEALKKVTATVKEDAASVEELRRWNAQYGEDGSRHATGPAYFI